MNSNKTINIWELGTKINIRVTQRFIDLVNGEIRTQFKTKRKVHKELIKFYKVPYSTFKTRMKRRYKYFIDLEILLYLCKILGISLNKLQDNITAYKARRGHNYIENPKLPIEITPIFDMLIAHFMGDGFVIKCDERRKKYFGYRQYDDEYRNLFVKKIESVFGKLNYNKKYFNEENNTQIYFPVAVSELMFKLYDLNSNSFLTEKSRIPKEIMNQDWKHKLAFLIGMIVDEGHIDSTLIVIRLKNRGLITDLSKICIDLKYKNTTKEQKDGLYALYILSEGVHKFYQDYQVLLEEYPEVNLGYKGEKIKEFINRKDKPKRYVRGNKAKLLKELSERDLTVNQLAKRLNMTRQGARYLIKKLEEENKVEIKSIEKFGNYKYGKVI